MCLQENSLPSQYLRFQHHKIGIELSHMSSSILCPDSCNSVLNAHLNLVLPVYKIQNWT